MHAHIIPTVEKQVQFMVDVIANLVDHFWNRIPICAYDI